MTIPRNREELAETLADGIAPEGMLVTARFAAKEILSALDAAGLVIVPREATVEMRIVGARAMEQDDLQPTDHEFGDGYEAAVSASPFIAEKP